MAVYEKYSQEVSMELVYIFIDYLRFKSYDYIVAPYEADSQLAYMYRNKQIDFVATEDSDFFAMGCYKLVRGIKRDGKYVRFNADPAPHLKSPHWEKFSALSDRRRILLCIMTGCDYVDNVKGIGFVSLLNIFWTNKKLEDQKFDEMLLEFFKQRTNRSQSEYLSHCRDILATFQNQVVYDRLRNRLVHSSPQLFKGKNQAGFVGEFFTNHEQFVQGKLDIRTMKPRTESDIDFSKLVRYVNYVSPSRVFTLNNLTREQFNFNTFSYNINIDQSDEDLASCEEGSGAGVLKMRSVTTMSKSNGSTTEASSEQSVFQRKTSLVNCGKKLKVN